MASTISPVLVSDTDVKQQLNYAASDINALQVLSTKTWQFVSSTPITAVAQIDFTGLAAGYDYRFSIRNAVPAAASDFKMRVSQATVFDTGSSYMTGGGAANAASSLTVTNSNTHATATNGGLSADIILLNPASTTEYKTFLTTAQWANASGNINGTSVGGGRFSANTNAVDGVRFFFSGQNLTAVGSIILYKAPIA